MIKRTEIEQPDSVWNRTADDEPVFILCGRDILAPEGVALWIARAKAAGVDPRKIKSAIAGLDRMQAWQLEHPERVKTPDFSPGDTNGEANQTPR